MKNKEKLLTVRRYADSKKYSTTWVYRLIKNGQLKGKEISGVMFVVVK